MQLGQRWRDRARGSCRRRREVAAQTAMATATPVPKAAHAERVAIALVDGSVFK
jgi:hypothetical protein